MTHDLTTSLLEAGALWNLILKFVSLMLADCTGTSHKVHESDNRHKKVQKINRKAIAII